MLISIVIIIIIIIIIINTLAEEFFIPFRGHGDNFLHTSHGDDAFSSLLFCLARTFFFGTHVSGLRIEAPPLSTVQGKCYIHLYTLLFKAENQKIQFYSYVLNLVKINIIFFFLKSFVVHVPIFGPSMPNS